MISKRDLTRSRTPTDTEMKYQLSQIPNKVDKEPNKGLSTNDFTNEYKQELERVSQGQHHHNNLGVLNSISRDEVNNWNRAYNLVNELINPIELYNSEYGTNENITFEKDPTNYMYLLIICGNATDYENKLIIPTDKQFCITVGDEKSYYKFNNQVLEKQSGSNTILIYKVLGYFEKGEM